MDDEQDEKTVRRAAHLEELILSIEAEIDQLKAELRDQMDATARLRTKIARVRAEDARSMAQIRDLTEGES